MQSDTASVLSEATAYIKFLHEQLQVSPPSLNLLTIYSPIGILCSLSLTCHQTVCIAGALCSISQEGNDREDGGQLSLQSNSQLLREIQGGSQTPFADNHLFLFVM